VNWKTFLRVALPLASLAGLIVITLPLAGWLVVFPLSVVSSIRLYSRREPGRLNPGQGARMGIAVATITFVLSSALFGVMAAHDPDDYRKAVAQAVKSVQEIEARTPDSPPLSRALAGPRGVVLFTCISLICLLAILLVIGSVTGALTAAVAGRSG
jgi:hypothetical protein